MKRCVVIEGSICSKPVYIARNEEDAAAFLDAQEKKQERLGATVVRINSLHLQYRTGGMYQTLEVYLTPSWEEFEVNPDQFQTATPPQETQ